MIDSVLEHEKGFGRSPGKLKPTDKPTCFAAKHATCNDFDSAPSLGGRIANVHDHGGHYTADCQNRISRYAAARDAL